MGCFTANVNSFVNRPWEAQGMFSYSLRRDTKILIEFIGKRIMRILPYVDSNEWIPNASRFTVNEVIIIYPQSKVFLGNRYTKPISIFARKKRSLHERLSIFSKAMKRFKSVFKVSFGLFLNSFVDVKEASNLRSLETSPIRLNISRNNARNVCFI